MSFLFFTSVSASLPLVPLHHFVPDLRLALGKALASRSMYPRPSQSAHPFCLQLPRCGAMHTEPHEGGGRTSGGLLHFSLSLPILSGTAIKARVLTPANNPRLPSGHQVTLGCSLTRTENPATEASSPPLPLSLAVPQLISRHNTGLVFLS